MNSSRASFVVALAAAVAWVAPTAAAAEPVRFELLVERYDGVTSDELEVRVRAANTDHELLELWRELELGTTPPEVDLDRWLLVGFNSGVLGGCNLFRVDGVDRDGAPVTVRGATVPPTPGTSCGGQPNEARIALTLEQADVPPGRGTVMYTREGVPKASTEAHPRGDRIRRAAAGDRHCPARHRAHRLAAGRRGGGAHVRRGVAPAPHHRGAGALNAAPRIRGVPSSVRSRASPLDRSPGHARTSCRTDAGFVTRRPASVRRFLLPAPRGASAVTSWRGWFAVALTVAVAWTAPATAAAEPLQADLLADVIA